MQQNEQNEMTPKGYRPSPFDKSHLAHVMKTHELMGNFIEVCNLALEKHKGSFPFSQFIYLGNQLLSGKHFGVEVYKDKPFQTYDYYTITFEDGRILIAGHGKESPVIEWKVGRDYLEKVVEDPNHYIDNPLMLDWDWLRSRIGL